ncbi:hypothetical protein EJ03DRAFT_197787 [Teratosphaeria nubilosa]|uniref:Uncharacterized protein n=1 Tax=Teratosphaeria nubilosa TaxID=161662 RepID=A0A6G1KYV1_9PEZI|nr:hypothetical protein EJ03DRAFT_197787 [Teratosphaeria nubilosa]
MIWRDGIGRAHLYSPMICIEHRLFFISNQGRFDEAMLIVGAGLIHVQCGLRDHAAHVQYAVRSSNKHSRVCTAELGVLHVWSVGLKYSRLRRMTGPELGWAEQATSPPASPQAGHPACRPRNLCDRRVTRSAVGRSQQIHPVGHCLRHGMKSAVAAQDPDRVGPWSASSALG